MSRVEKHIEVNNGCEIVLQLNEDKLEVVKVDERDGIEYSYVIPDGEIVMLLNYYLNCKLGHTGSDYIEKGSIIDTNSNTEVRMWSDLLNK